MTSWRIDFLIWNKWQKLYQQHPEIYPCEKASYEKLERQAQAKAGAVWTFTVSCSLLVKSPFILATDVCSQALAICSASESLCNQHGHRKRGLLLVLDDTSALNQKSFSYDHPKPCSGKLLFSFSDSGCANILTKCSWLLCVQFMPSRKAICYNATQGTH